MLQNILNKFRAWRIRKKIRKAVYFIDGIDKVNQDFLYNIILELAKRYSNSVYKNVSVLARKKTAYRLREGRKGHFFPYLELEIRARRGCCNKEVLFLKNSKMFWQIVIHSIDKLDNVKISEPKDALIFLGLAKPKQ
ncbi:MAG: hypothetical protein P8J32_01880 [bacterium]|nr:hypothetical protein [bacterium]